jgi:hypothetical protein
MVVSWVNVGRDVGTRFGRLDELLGFFKIINILHKSGLSKSDGSGLPCQSWTTFPPRKGLRRCKTPKRMWRSICTSQVAVPSRTPSLTRWWTRMISLICVAYRPISMWFVR